MEVPCAYERLKGQGTSSNCRGWNNVTTAPVGELVRSQNLLDTFAPFLLFCSSMGVIDFHKLFEHPAGESEHLFRPATRLPLQPAFNLVAAVALRGSP